MIKYRIGWCADDLEELEAVHHDIDRMDSDEFIEDMAKDYAEKHHEICEDLDLQFSVFVKVGEQLKEVEFKTDFEPVYYVDSIS